MNQEMRISELEAKLPDGEITINALSHPATGEAIISYAANLASIVSKKMRAYERDSGEYFHLDGLCKQLRSFRWSFPLKLCKTRADRFDRTKPALSGPLFTSDSHPWPSQGGIFREPVAQICLGEVGGLAGIHLGDGLLQLWVGPEWDDEVVRIIPIDDLSVQAASPIPDDITDGYFGGSCENPSYSVGSVSAWPATDNRGESHVWAIEGVKPQVLSWPQRITNENDNPDLDELYNDASFGVVEDFLQLLPLEAPSEGHHLFGNFESIQYDVEESPPTLLGLESRDPFLWGDHGNAQVSYQVSRSSNARFGFNWSCY